MIEGRVSCDKCGDSLALETIEFSYNGIRFHNVNEKFIEYRLRVVHSNGAVSYKNILICKKCSELLNTVIAEAQATFFKEVK